MASYKTHLHYAAGISIFFSILLSKSKLINSVNIILFFCMGMLGGILPDIDSDNSNSLKNIFSILAIFTAFLIIFKTVKYYSIVELLILWSVCFYLIRYVIFKLFKRLTIHRGLFHSIPCALFFCILVSIICNYFFQMNSFESWFSGIFLLIGYLVHLILDEIYSIEFSKKRLKWSFGSAFKFISFNKPYHYIILYLMIIGLIFISPDFKMSESEMTLEEFLFSIKSNFFPDYTWFMIQK